MKLGLENITSVLNSLGNPQEKFPAVLVAGTNGKGSVSSFISSILRRAGLKTGTFYSPHLFRINERIQIDGREIPSQILDDYLGELRKNYHRRPFTFFEGVTAAAVLYFLESKVDIAVFEVGLGGRLDATRLVNAVISVITGISIDHSRHLGETREQILREKLGVVKRGVPAVVNLSAPALCRAAADYCSEQQAAMVNAAEAVETEFVKITPEKMLFSLKTDSYDYGVVESQIIGRHQMKNAATAVKSVELLAEKSGTEYFDSVREGIKRGYLPGRFQISAVGPGIIMDVSHNEESLLGSLSTLREISPPDRNIIVFGCMERKDLGKFPAEVVKTARRIFLAPLSHSGAASEEELRKRFSPGAEQPGVPSAEVTLCKNMEEAIYMSRNLLKEDEYMLVLGSHHAVEEAVSYL